MSQSTLKGAYTCGYSGHTPSELKRAADELGAVVIDIRMSPRSRMPAWNRDNLRAMMGDTKYFHVPALGNGNYGMSLPIRIASPQRGLAQVEALAKAWPVILFCGCRDYETCHRRLVAEMLRERGVDVEELTWPTSAPSIGKMKVLSLHQPYASLMFVLDDQGRALKSIETRSWQTSHRGLMLIHATKSDEYLELGLTQPFAQALRQGGFETLGDLPRGAIVGVCELLECVRTEDIDFQDCSPFEKDFGNYSPRRFGWVTTNSRRFPKPLPARGYQNLWEVDFDLEAALRGELEAIHQEPPTPRTRAPEHHCHARYCEVKVPPKLLFCKKHWSLVPRSLQREVWKHYRPGQEIDKRPSREYLDVMKRAIEAVADYENQAVEPAQSTLF